MADLIDRTARHPRMPDGTIHLMDGEPYTVPSGRAYRTICGQTLTGRHGAMLTTRDSDCHDCTDFTPADQRARDLVEAVLRGMP